MLASPSSIAYIGTVVHSTSLAKVEVLERAAVVVDSSGCVVRVIPAEEMKSFSSSVAGGRGIKRPPRSKSIENMLSTAPGTGLASELGAVRIVDLGTKIIMPGFVDGHAHAPQYAFAGTAVDLPLLDWLNKYTFPTEQKFTDLAYAKKVYKNSVRRHLRNGTTTCSYFATTHEAASKILVDEVRRQGQRGLVGKVNMDRNSPSSYVEDTAESLAATERFCDYVDATRSAEDPLGLVEAVITPRFVPTCSTPLMTGLADIAKRRKLAVQSHLSETKREQAWVKELHPESETYAGVYDDAGLLSASGRSYMAHCCHSCGTERALLRRRNTGIVHCPNSNFTLASGVLDVRQMLAEGLNVGLGTDVAGGYSACMLDAVRQAFIAGRATHFADRKKPPLSLDEVFFLATQGGANALGLGDKVGNFATGKYFDALIIDCDARDSRVDIMSEDSARDAFSKFLLLGDDRNIVQIFVAGRRVVTRDLAEELKEDKRRRI